MKTKTITTRIALSNEYWVPDLEIKASDEARWDIAMGQMIEEEEALMVYFSVLPHLPLGGSWESRELWIRYRRSPEPQRACILQLEYAVRNKRGHYGRWRIMARKGNRRALIEDAFNSLPPEYKALVGFAL